MDITVIVFFVVLAVVVFLMGVFYGIRSYETVLLKAVEELDTKSIDIKKEHVTLILEKHDNIFYLFDKDTNLFLCQSDNLVDLGNILLKYKKISKALVQNDIKSFWYINGKISEDFQ